MNGEVAQIRDIAIYARHALKTKSKISYKVKILSLEMVIII